MVMKLKELYRIGLCISLIITFNACATGKKQYDVGMQLSQAGKKREAITHLEQAIAQEPKNEKYQKTLADLKASFTGDLLKEVDEILKAESPPTISSIAKAKTKLREAKDMNPADPKVQISEARLQKAENSLMVKVKGLHSRAKQHVQAQAWYEGYLELQQIQRLFPGYEDTVQLMKQMTNKGSQAFYQKGKALYDKKDFRGSADYLRKALTLKSDHQSSIELLALATQRDNKDYFIEEAQKAAAEQKWAEALQAYVRALEYAPKNQAIIESKNNVQSKAGIYYVRQGKSHMYAGWFHKAFENYEQAAQNIHNLNNSEVSSLLNGFKTELSAKAAILANRFKDAGRYGSAWFWYEKIRQIDPDYPDIFYLIQAMEDEIIKRLKKSIAVFDFGSPSYAPDAGSIFANNLSTFLFKSASKDVKILERENLKSILDEMKLGQIGVVSSQTAKEIGRVYGIDVAVMGSVLRYNVDSTSYADAKTVTYQVKKTEENIEYLNWKARNPNPTREQLDLAPVPFIHKMMDMEKEYNVSTHKKVAFVTVSFRIVDINTGENILVDTIPRTKVATDETSAGVQIAGIKYDPLEIPTDTELLQELTNEVVIELGREALQPLKSLEKTYFESGERKLRRRDSVGAAEHFVDAIFDEKIKKMQNSPLTTKALQNLEDVFHNYKEQLEG
jgi:tetratricopeptide (TPR) repeat protein